jgi:hypothetical protein
MSWMFGCSSPGRSWEFFLLHHSAQTGSEAHPAFYPSLVVKQLVHEADHSLPSSAKVENVWSYNLTPMPSWHGAQLKHRTALPFTFTLKSQLHDLFDVERKIQCLMKCDRN